MGIDIGIVPNLGGGSSLVRAKTSRFRLKIILKTRSNQLQCIN